MKPPHLNRALDLQAEERVPDGSGGYTRTWASLGTLWAEVVAGTGRDPAGEEVILSSVPYRITVRAAPVGSSTRPRPEQRLVEGTRIFTILAVTERDQPGRYLVCFCREEAPR
jgi:head-tail adaptor